MILAYLLLLTGLTISSVAIYYSVVGLTAIFSAAAVPIMVMGISLEVGKLVTASWVKQHWTRLPVLMKSYALVAVTILMIITSLGIFGFLSKAHSDQTLVSGDVQSKIAIYDEKIRTAKENIDADRKAIKQMDDAVDQVMGRSTSETGADKAVAIRRGQQKERTRLAQDIETEQKKINQLMEDRAPIAAEVRKVEAEVGPIKYIAAFVYGDNPDASVLERAVTWVIILIVIVFDPLAVVMLLAAQMTFVWIREEREEKDEPLLHPTVAHTETPVYDEPVIAESDTQVEEKPTAEESKSEPILCYKCGTELVNAPGIGPFCPNRTCDVMDNTSGKEVEIVNAQPPGWMFTNLVSKEEQSAVDDTLPPDEEIPDFTEEISTIEQLPESARPKEAAPARGRGIMHSHLVVEADNVEPATTPSATGFGSVFPVDPTRGDVYLRIDYLPNRLFKFNGQKWIQVDKEQTDVYAYDEEYIKYLIAQIDTGSYDPDLLTTIEREQIQQYLSKNV